MTDDTRLLGCASCQRHTMHRLSCVNPAVWICTACIAHRAWGSRLAFGDHDPGGMFEWPLASAGSQALRPRIAAVTEEEPTP